MATAGFEEKFVAFVDVMGFKEMVGAAERDGGRTVPEIFELSPDAETDNDG